MPCWGHKVNHKVNHQVNHIKINHIYLLAELSLTKSSGETDDVYDDACNAGVPNGMYARVDLLQQEKQTDKIMCRPNIGSNCPNHQSPVSPVFNCLRSKHVSHTSSSCFYWLRQIRRLRHSFDTESATTLIHAFLSSCVDSCNTVLAGRERPLMIVFSMC